MELDANWVFHVFSLARQVLGFQRDSVISVVVMAAPKITLTYFNIEAAAEKGPLSKTSVSDSGLDLLCFKLF